MASEREQPMIDALWEIRVHARQRLLADGKVSATWLVEITDKAIKKTQASPSEPSPGGALALTTSDDVACYCGKRRLPCSARAEILSITDADGIEHRHRSCAPAESYCLCGHAKMAHAGTGCLILGGPKGGCGCREYLPEPAPKGGR